MSPTEPFATSIAGQDARDTTLVISFALGDPLGLVTVEAPQADAMDAEQYVALVEETATRLTIYAHDFRQARGEEVEERAVVAQERLEMRPYIEREVRCGAC